MTAGTGRDPDPSVEVVGYRRDWPALFEAERSALSAAVGSVARSIEHIGSTAVPGLCSKPTIDVLMVVDDPAAFVEKLPQVEALGYEHREGAFGDDSHHQFLWKVVGGKRISHLHVLSAGSAEIGEYRLFRDVLRSDADLASRYADLKLDLARRYAGDRSSYVVEKEAWVGAVLRDLRSGPSDPASYDQIGLGYAGQRVPEPRWVDQVVAALGGARSILNVGAGTGNYEPPNRRVIAVEPSSAMMTQRRNSNPVVQGVAERLPFRDGTFDAALATFTVHHWVDRAAGLSELRRVARRQVLVVYESLAAHRFWLLDYFPEILLAPIEANAPTPEAIGEHLDVVDVQTMWIPADCTDGVAAAYWRRPEAYLDPAVQRSMSVLALLPEAARVRGAAELASDLADGTWAARHGHLLDQETADYGYRLVIAGG